MNPDICTITLSFYIQVSVLHTCKLFNVINIKIKIHMNSDVIFTMFFNTSSILSHIQGDIEERSRKLNNKRKYNKSNEKDFFSCFIGT